MRFNSGNRHSRGSGLRIGPGSISPFVKIMLIANAAVFLLQQLAGVRFTLLLSLSPDLFYEQFPNYIYQVFTYMFLHGGIWHLVFNMFMLWMFGTEIEYTWGSKTFARFYLLCGITGGVLPLVTHSIFSTGSGYILGASGAIYGVLIAYWLMFPERMLYLYFLFPVKVKYAIPGLMLLGLLFGGAGVAHAAHLGGALFALAYLKLDWHLFSFGKRIRNLHYKRQTTKLNRRRQQAEDIMNRVDSILDKINEVGIENISKADRKFLEDASSELSQKKDKQKR